MNFFLKKKNNGCKPVTLNSSICWAAGVLYQTSLKQKYVESSIPFKSLFFVISNLQPFLIVRLVYLFNSISTPYGLSNAESVAQSAWAVEYTNCFSTAREDPTNEYPRYDTKTVLTFKLHTYVKLNCLK